MRLKFLTVLTTILQLWRWCHAVWQIHTSFLQNTCLHLHRKQWFPLLHQYIRLPIASNCIKLPLTTTMTFSCIIISYQFAKGASSGYHFICIDTTVTYQWIMQFHQLLFLQWHFDGCWNSQPSHTIPNNTQHCKFDNISYIHAHAQMTVIYTYFSASFTVVAQDEDTKMHFIIQWYLLYKELLTIKITYTQWLKSERESAVLGNDMLVEMSPHQAKWH